MKEKKKTVFDKLWKWFCNKIWYIFLLGISTVYVFYYRYEIYELKELNARSLIFIIWLILLLFPLFSEMELLGIKIKREVEKANKEVKDDIKELEAQFMELKLSNNIANNIQIGNPILPSEEKIEELLRIVRNMQQGSVEPKTSKYDLPQDKAVYLFKVRLYIEKPLRQLSEGIGYGGTRPLGLSEMVKCLFKKEVIDEVTMELITQVIKIAMRGIHGEIVSDEYIEFVQRVYPEIESKLESSLHTISDI